MHVRWNDHEERPPPIPNKQGNPLKVQESSGKTTGKQNDQAAGSDLFQALFPIYHVSKFCGLLPVRYVEQSSGKYTIRLSLVDSIYSICLLVVVLGLELWGFWRDLKDGWENSTRLKSRTAIIATCSDVFGLVALTVVSVVGSFFRWKHFQIIMDKLVEADDKINLVSPKRTRRYAVILVSFMLTFVVITSAIDFYVWHRESQENKKMSDKGPMNYVAIYLMYIIIIVMECQYAVSTYNLGRRFYRLNKCLDNILRTCQITDHFRRDLGLAGDLGDQGRTSPYAKQDSQGGRAFRKAKILDWYPVANDKRSLAASISDLVTVHSSLCDSVMHINSAFGVATLVVTLTCLLHLIITPYFLIMEFDGSREWLFLVVQFLWVIVHVSRMLIVVQPTYATVAESKNTAIVISQLLALNPDKEAKKNLEIFSLQLLHRPLEFSACGLFSLDRALVTSIAGAVTTYLVILIQFQKADDTKCEVDNIIKNATQMWKNVTSLNLTALKTTS